MSMNDNIKLRIEYSENDYQILINKNSTIQNLKIEIKKKLNINIDEQVLICGGYILENNKLIKDYNVTNDDKIILIKKKKEKINIEQNPINNQIIHNNIESNENLETLKITQEKGTFEKIKKVFNSVLDIFIKKDDKNNNNNNNNNNKNNKNNNNYNYNNNNNSNHERIIVPEGTYDTQLNQLIDLGFLDNEINLQLLYEFQGNIERCVEKLLQIYKN